MKNISPAEQTLVVQRLERELRFAQESAQKAHDAARAAQKQESTLRLKAAELQKEILKLEQVRTEPLISEHALLRWIERVEGVDLDALRAHILGGRTGESIKFAGSGTVIKDGYTLVFKNRIVVTVHAGEKEK
jgi:hypothetical protein